MNKSGSDEEAEMLRDFARSDKVVAFWRKVFDTPEWQARIEKYWGPFKDDGDI